MGFVMASKGYPGDYEKGYEIVIPEEIAGRAGNDGCRPDEAGNDGCRPDEAGNDEGVRIYHMGTALKDGRYHTAGGRVLMVVGFGADLQEAHDKALAAVESIECDNLFYRRDIGWRVL